MINLILQYPKLYRLYQKTVRSDYSEYDFFKFIFSNLKIKNQEFWTCVVVIALY